MHVFDLHFRFDIKRLCNLKLRPFKHGDNYFKESEQLTYPRLGIHLCVFL